MTARFYVKALKRLASWACSTAPAMTLLWPFLAPAWAWITAAVWS